MFDGNRHDCLTLRLGISKNDPLATEKYALLVSYIFGFFYAQNLRWNDCSDNQASLTKPNTFQDRLSIPRNGIFYVAFEGDSIVDGVVVAFLRIITVTSREELVIYTMN